MLKWSVLSIYFCRLARRDLFQFPKCKNRNGDELKELIAVLLFFHQRFHPVADPFWWNRCCGMHPVWRVPQVSFLTFLSICGAEGWVFNRDSGNLPASS